MHGSLSNMRYRILDTLEKKGSQVSNDPSQDFLFKIFFNAWSRNFRPPPKLNPKQANERARVMDE